MHDAHGATDERGQIAGTHRHGHLGRRACTPTTTAATHPHILLDGQATIAKRPKRYCTHRRSRMRACGNQDTRTAAPVGAHTRQLPLGATKSACSVRTPPAIKPSITRVKKLVAVLGTKLQGALWPHARATPHPATRAGDRACATHAQLHLSQQPEAAFRSPLPTRTSSSAAKASGSRRRRLPPLLPLPPPPLLPLPPPPPTNTGWPRTLRRWRLSARRPRRRPSRPTAGSSRTARRLSRRPRRRRCGGCCPR